MPLENLENRIDVRQLSLEKPESESGLPFDPERDMTDQDWQNMLMLAKETATTHNWDGFIHIAPYMKLLFPERESELPLDHNTRRGLINRIAASIANSRWGDAADFISNFRILFPGQSWAQENLPEGHWDNYKAVLENLRRAPNREFSFAQHAWDLKIMAPERTPELHLGSLEWEAMHKLLLEYHRVKEWSSYLSMSSYLKLLFPEKVQELIPDENTWREIRQQFRQYYQEDGKDLDQMPGYAAALKMLAAKSVTFRPGEGLEVIMPAPKSKVDELKSSIPETRKF